MSVLAAYLKRKKLTERALAELSGLSAPMINQIRAGNRRPSPEAAKRIEAATDGEVRAAALLGLEEAPAAFDHETVPRDLKDGRWAVTVAADGSLRLTPEMVAAFGFQPGERMLFRPEADYIRMHSSDKALKRLQDKMRALVPPGVSLVDELIADRRAEAARE